MQLINLANILTLINLLSGCMAIVFMFNYRMDLVPYLTVVSLIADFFDGFAARFTKNPTDIGKQLDSLADVVSFGLVPGAIMFQLLFQKYESDPVFYSTTKMYLLSAPAFLITLFAALRLAKFNVDTRQSDSFLGLATPAATIFVVGFLLVFMHNSFGLSELIFQRKILYVIVVLLSALMVSEIPMFAFKFKSFAWQTNQTVYLFIILSVILLATLKFAAIPLLIILYITVSIISAIRKKKSLTT
ncbi:MAG: CDP-diacylglycerol--serine O-phosphatidyltransferase [Bacteroidota bacterium]|nr:CDP-diacylglycerol--serine O-phosphatidyltransferase [Bacteroidota bacterium]